MKKNIFFYLPVFIFSLFCFSLITAFLIYRPGWGLVDDWLNLQMAEQFWQGKLSLRFLIDGPTEGRFRPLYNLYIITAYLISKPILLYIGLVLLNLSTLILWGWITIKIFEEKEQSLFTLLVFPLSSFVFTPFWNLFSFISIQERFIFFFGALSLCFFIQAYEKNRFRFLWLSLFSLLLATLGKETAVALGGAFFCFALADLAWLKENRRQSARALLLYTAFLFGYQMIIRKWMGGYSQDYQDNLNIPTIVKNLYSSPLYIKAILLLALSALIYFFTMKIRGKARFKNQLLIIPLFILFYLILLAPWSFVTYLLGFFAPFLLLLAFPLYRTLRDTSLVRRTVLATTALLPFVFFFLVDQTYLAEMSDIQKTVRALKTLKEQFPNAAYFFPQGYEESPKALSYYTQLDIHFLKEGELEGYRMGSGDNFLVYDHRSSYTDLRNVKRTGIVYQNGTWVIWRLEKAESAEEIFQPVFAQTLSTKILHQLKGL